MDKLNTIFIQLFKSTDEQLHDAATMNDIAGWDSLTHMDLIMAIEESFDLELDGDEIADMTSIGAIRKLLSGKKAL